jgi:hypothetical protein
MLKTIGKRSAEVLMVLGVSALCMLPGTVLAEEPATDKGPAVSASGDMGFFSKYVWRGFELSKDSLVIQPSATIGYGGFAMNLWGNLDTDQDADGENAFNETDLTLSYDFEVGPAAMSAGYIYYGLDGLDDTAEIYVSASFDTILAPTLSIYRDIDSLEGWYVKLGVSHSLTVTDTLSLDFGASAGYLSADDAESYATSDPTEAFSNLLDGLVSVSMTIPVNDVLSVTPSLSYSFPLGGDASDLLESTSFDGDKDSFVYGGITASLSF